MISDGLPAGCEAVDAVEAGLSLDGGGRDGGGSENGGVGELHFELCWLEEASVLGGIISVDVLLILYVMRTTVVF